MKERAAAARIVAVLGVARIGQEAEISAVEEHVSAETITVKFRHRGRSVRVEFDLVQPSVRVQ